MDLEIYKKFDNYTNSELVNYYLDLCVYNGSDYELFVLQQIMVNRFLTMYYEENDEV